MSIVRKLMILPPIAIGIALLAFAIWSKGPPVMVEPQEKRYPVRVVAVEARIFIPRVSGSGSVEPAHTWNAVAQVSGRVSYVNPEFVRGGTVAKDDVLVRLSPVDYELAIVQARSRIESAAAEFEETSLSTDTIHRSLQIERDALKLARRELERRRSLVGRGTLSTSVAESQELVTLAQRAKVQDLENELELLPTRLKALEQSKMVSEAGLEIANLNLERTVITAPFDARVAASDLEISQYIATGAVMGALDGIGAAEIDVQIPPRQMAGFVRLAFRGRSPTSDSGSGRVPRGAGLTAFVRVGFPGNEQGWDAKVTRISDTVDPETRSIGVIVSVANPYGEIRPGERPPLIKGMFTEVELRGPAVEDTILVPRAAVRDGEVMIAGPDDRLSFATVNVVYSYGDVAVLAGGLEPGTRVVVSDLSPAIEGMLLEPVPDPQTEARLDHIATPEQPGE